MCGEDSPDEVWVMVAAFALRSSHALGPGTPGGTAAEAAGGSHPRQREG